MGCIILRLVVNKFQIQMSGPPSTYSHTMKPNQTSSDRKIINVPPSQSSMRKGATQYPGQEGSVHFNQNFGDDDPAKLRRLNTGGETKGARDRAQYDNTFARGTQGGALDFHQIAKEEADQRKYMSGLSQTSKGIHQTSGASLPGISERERAVYSSNPNRIDDSTAAIDRPPKRIEGLTAFLRKEYYRRMGVYCNGARDEESILVQFWKEYVSEAYRKQREIEKQAAKQNATINQFKSMQELAKVDPAAARRKQLEIQQKEDKKREAAERAQRLQEKTASFGKKATLKRPQSGAVTTAKRSQPANTGSVAVAVPNLPKTENFAYFKYDFYKEQFELDVVFSINKDLEEIAQKEAEVENGYLYEREKKMKEQKLREEKKMYKKMLELFFFSEILQKEKLEEEKKQKEKKQEEEKKKSPKKETNELSQMPENKPIAEMMKGAKEGTQSLDLSRFDKEVVEKYQFMLKLSELVQTKSKGVMSNLPQFFKDCYLEDYSKFPRAESRSKITTDREGTAFIDEFFSNENFVKRLHLHKQKICSSTTKKEQTDILYFIQMNKVEKQLNFLDHPTGKEVLEKIVADKKKAEEDKRIQEQEKAEASEKKQKLRKERIEELAQPKDKWKVGKKLIELQKKFPHDRVLQRMIQEEFKQNQTFRYPEEYDIYKVEEEKSKKNWAVAPKPVKKDDGRKIPIWERWPDKSLVGQRYLEDFKKADIVAQRGTQEKTVLAKRTSKAFENALIVEAQAYLVEANKRLDQKQGERVTTRKYLAQIYQKFKQNPNLKPIIDEKYPVCTDGMVDNEEARQKVFPDNFKRDFSRLIKTLSSKKPGKMTITAVKKGSRRLPTTFMVAGLVNNHNKKILMTKTLATRRYQQTIETRTRVFYRDEFKGKKKEEEGPSIQDVFMSYDDQENCRFEPICGSLNPHHIPTEREKAEKADGKIRTYQERLGENFSSSNPEVFKKGILKKATGEFNKGEYEKAKNTLTRGFNINSLKNHMDPNWNQKKAKTDAKKNKLKVLQTSTNTKISSDECVLLPEGVNGVLVCIGWTAMKNIDLDISVIPLNENRRENNIVDFERMKAGGVTLRMEDKKEQDINDDNKIIRFDMNQLRVDSKEVYVVANINEGGTFDDIQDAYLRLCVAKPEKKDGIFSPGHELARYKLENKLTDSGLIYCKLIRVGQPSLISQRWALVTYGKSCGGKKGKSPETLNAIKEISMKAENAKEQEEIEKLYEEQKKEGGFNAINLDAMREDPAEDQKKMAQEEWDKPKLIPILTEAYNLLIAIEGKTTEAEKKYKQLQKAKEKLRAKHKQLQEFHSVDDQANNVGFLFKTIMCPYRDKCPKDRRSRWPKSGLTNVTQFGSACLYAHHPNELQFPETLKIQMQSIKQTQKHVMAQAAEQKPAKPFAPAGPLVDCSGGCTDKQKCNTCRYRQANLLPTPQQQSTLNEKMRKQREKYEAPHVTTYINEMRQIGEELKLFDEDGKKKVVDDNYYVKFGHLKKAAVLKFYGRNNDAYKEVIKAGEIVKKQLAVNADKDAAIQRRWQFKLGLEEGWEPPFPLDKYHPSDPRMEKELRSTDLGGVPLQTVKTYIEKVSPYNLDAFSKNVYLDRCIEELIIECENDRMNKKHGVDKMKKQVEKLEELAELAETFGEEGLEDQLDDDGEPIKFKQRKTKMCECVVEPAETPGEPKCIFHKKPKGVWTYDREMEQYQWKAESQKEEKDAAKQEEKAQELESVVKSMFERKKHFNCPKQRAHLASPKKHPPCPKAHNPLELELIPVSDKIQNLKGVIQVSKEQLNNNKTMQAWIPANSQLQDDISCFQPYIEKIYQKVQEDDGAEDKPKSIFERENLFRNMEDDKD